MMIKIKHMEVVVLTLAPFSNLLVMHSCMFLNAVHIDVKVKIARHESIFPLSLFFWKALIMIFLCCTYGVTEKEERSFIFEGGGGGAEGCNKKYRKFARLLVSWRRIYPKNVIFIFFTKSPLFCMLHNFYAPYKKNKPSKLNQNVKIVVKAWMFTL